MTSKRCWLKAFPLLLLCALSFRSGAADYYVDTGNASASDNNLGTAVSPWKTITKPNQTLSAGDTVYIRKGTYTTYIAPSHSGTASAPITYSNYPGENVIIQNATYGAWLNGKSWIVIGGINFSNLDHMMILENGANNNTVAYCNFVGMRTQTTYCGSRIWLLSHSNYVHHCVFGRWGQCSGGSSSGGVLEIGFDDGDASYPGNYNRIESCTIYDGGHHTLGVHGNHNIIRSNYTYNLAWTAGRGERTLYMNGYSSYCNRNLIEWNRIGYSDVPCNTFGAPGAQISSEYNIFRRNYFFFNNLSAIQFSTTDNYHPNGPNWNYVYNNTFHHNGWQTDNGADDQQRSQIGFQNWSTSFTVRSNVIKNNIFYDAPRVYGYNGSSAGQQLIGTNYNGDVSGSARFVNATSTPGNPTDTTYPNLALQSSSPAINIGAPLTTITSSSGTGSLIVVADANYFCDGWGQIPGDIIQLQGSTATARITSISGNNIALASPLTWTKGQGLCLTYSGSAPDMGAYEYDSGQANRPNAPINLRVTPSF